MNPNKHLLALLATLALGASACDGSDDKTDEDTDTDTDTMDTDDTDPMVDNPCDVPGVTCDEANMVAVVSGTIEESFTMLSDWSWVLEGGVFIDNNSTLTIQPGTTVFGDSATDGFLVIERGSKIMAEGTADAPIVFTSSLNDGSRGRSDWGGLVINGRAPTNVCPDLSNCNVPGEAGTGTYGGDVADDDSGVLSYVRVEFAGTLVNDTNELNGIAFQGVGSGTQIDHIHVHRCADDGVEFYGGTAQAKYVLITGTGDDGLDWTDGWSGKAQHVIVHHFSDDGDNGIEADNNGDVNESEPYSDPIIQNVSVFGTSGNDIGILLREGTKGQVWKAATAGYGDHCAALDQEQTYINAFDGTPSLAVALGVFACAADNDGYEDLCATEDTVPAWCQPRIDAGESALDLYGASTTGANVAIMSGSETAPDYRPAAGSDLLGVTGGVSGDAWFDTTDYAGGAAADADWWAWTEFAEN